MNKYLATIIKKLFPKELPKPLGRWKIDYNSKKLKHKIDLSNEDHCGPCGQYAMSKTKFENKHNINPNKIINIKK